LNRLYSSKDELDQGLHLPNNTATSQSCTAIKEALHWKNQDEEVEDLIYILRKFDELNMQASK